MEKLTTATLRGAAERAHYCRNEEEYLSHASAERCVAVLVPSDTDERVVTIGELDLVAYRNQQRGNTRDAGKS